MVYPIILNAIVEINANINEFNSAFESLCHDLANINNFLNKYVDIIYITPMKKINNVILLDPNLTNQLNVKGILINRINDVNISLDYLGKRLDRIKDIDRDLAISINFEGNQYDECIGKFISCWHKYNYISKSSNTILSCKTIVIE